MTLIALIFRSGTDLISVSFWFSEVSNQMLELYEQNRNNGATGSLANDPSPSEMNRGHAPASSFQAPSANGNHQQQSTSGKPQAVESNADEASSHQVEDKAGDTLRSLSPRERTSDARRKGGPEPPEGQILNRVIKQEITVKTKVVRANVEKNELHIESRDFNSIATQVDKKDGESVA